MSKFVFTGNHFETTNGAGDVAQAMAAHTQLQSIDVEGTNFNDAQCALIRIACEMNQSKSDTFGSSSKS